MAQATCSDCNSLINEGADYKLECGEHSVCKGCLTKRAQDPTAMLDCSPCVKRPLVAPESASDPEKQLLATPPKIGADSSSASYRDVLLSQSPTSSPIKAPPGDVVESSKLQPSDPPIEPGIWMYVDDSNLWIEAKKLQGKLKSFKTCEDHRVRIDTGRLTDVLAGGRPVEQGFLYGSEPPEIDKVWEKIRSNGWKVDTSKKSRITGKEKKVDTKLVADVTERVCTTPPEKRSTIVFVTGDADMLPAIEKVVAYGWNAEIYMWQQALSAELRKYAAESSNRCKVTFLDDFIKKFTFTNRKFDIKNERLRKEIDKNGIVFSMIPMMFRNRLPTEKWCNQLDSIAQWPFQYYWFVCNDEPTDDLVVVFLEDSKIGAFDVENFLKDIKHGIDSKVEEGSKFALPGVVAVQTYRQYITEKYELIDQSGLPTRVHLTLDQPGDFSTDDLCSESDDKDDESGAIVSEWNDVKKRVQRRKRQIYSDPCPYEFNCQYGSRCYYKHTRKEKEFFKQNNGNGNPFFKVKPCNNPNCKKPKSQCLGAHGEDDAWCLSCRSRGHFTENCEKRAVPKSS